MQAQCKTEEQVMRFKDDIITVSRQLPGLTATVGSGMFDALAHELFNGASLAGARASAQGSAP
jgi:hypothetical protein